MGGGAAKSDVAAPEDVNGHKFLGQVVEGFDPKGLRAAVDEMKKRLGSGIGALVAVNDGRASVAVGVTDDLAGQVSAVDLVKAAVATLGGQGGGGRPDMAQGGGPDGSKAKEALDAVKDALREGRRLIDTTSGEPITLNGVMPLRSGQVRRHAHRGLRLRAALHLLDLPDARRGRGDLNARRLPDHAGRGQARDLSLQHHVRRAPFLHRLRHLHASQAALEPEPARRQCRLPAKACRPSISREVVVYDGQRHPGDNSSQTTYTAGILTFTPTEN